MHVTKYHEANARFYVFIYLFFITSSYMYTTLVLPQTVAFTFCELIYCYHIFPLPLTIDPQFEIITLIDVCVVTLESRRQPSKMHSETWIFEACGLKFFAKWYSVHP